MNELVQLVPHANTAALEKITSFGYAIQSSDDTAITKILPDFPSDNLKLIARINALNPSSTPFQLLYRLYPFESFLPKESHGSVMTLFDALDIPTQKVANKSWIGSFKQSKEQQITSVERPTLSKALLETGADRQYHKGIAILLILTAISKHIEFNRRFNFFTKTISSIKTFYSHDSIEWRRICN